LNDKEGFLHDYLVASFIGLAFGMAVSAPAAGAAGNWGPYIGIVVITGLFGFIPAGLIAGYINFRFHQMSGNNRMAGLNAGIFTAVVYAIITLIISIVGAIANTPAAATIFIAWIISVVFAIIFMPVGGYISGMLEEKPYDMPGFFNIGKTQSMPPPPPTTIQNCPTCGRPMKFVQQYNRWYCEHEKKYA